MNEAEDIIISSADIIASTITNKVQFTQLFMFLAKERFEPHIVQTTLLKAIGNLAWLNVHQETIDLVLSVDHSVRRSMKNAAKCVN